MRQVIIEPAEEGSYSQGETWEEVIINLREAIEVYIEDMVAHGEEVADDHFNRVLVVV